MSTPSVCSFKAMVAYWLNGELPESVCETTYDPFDRMRWYDVFAAAETSTDKT